MRWYISFLCCFTYTIFVKSVYYIRIRRSYAVFIDGPIELLSHLQKVCRKDSEQYNGFKLEVPMGDWSNFKHNGLYSQLEQFTKYKLINILDTIEASGYKMISTHGTSEEECYVFNK